MILLPLALVLALAGPGDAERAWEAGRFEEAFALFHARLDAGQSEPGPTLFNLGNCAYRLGRHAEAVLWFRRAALRLPDDPQVAFNLRLAQRHLGLKGDDVAPETGFARELRRVTAFQWLVILGSAHAVGVVGLFLSGRRRGLRIAAGLLLASALAGAVPWARSHFDPDPPGGVVLAGEAVLRREPHPDQPVVTRVRAGDSVRVLERSARWLRVAHSSGEGWTEQNGIGLVE